MVIYPQDYPESQHHNMHGDESSQESDLPHQLNPIKSSWASVNIEQYCDVLETACLYHSMTNIGLMQPSCQ